MNCEYEWWKVNNKSINLFVFYWRLKVPSNHPSASFCHTFVSMLTINLDPKTKILNNYFPTHPS